MAVSLDPEALALAASGGDRRALARCISIIEDHRPGAGELLATLYPRGGNAQVVGITGAPGAGKSTLTDGWIRHLRREGRTVAVVAVDPSSPLTGGSILGDRIRMQDHVTDPGVFVRSMSSRGHLGGLADATAQVVGVLDGCGFDMVLVETVGVGQSEVEVMGIADTTVVVVTPGWGDSVQAAKAGLTEIGDVFVVNKADLPGADQVAAELAHMLDLGLDLGTAGPWQSPIVSCQAERGAGVTEAWLAVQSHWEFLKTGDRLADQRRAQAENVIRGAVKVVTLRLARRVGSDKLDPVLLDRVQDRVLDPWAAAAIMMSSGG